RVATQGLADVLAVDDRQADVHPRMKLRKGGNRKGDKILCRTDRADRYASAGSAGDHVERRRATVNRGFDALEKRIQFLSGRREGHALAGSLKQGQPAKLLKIPQLQRDRGL